MSDSPSFNKIAWEKLQCLSFYDHCLKQFLKCGQSRSGES